MGVSLEDICSSSSQSSPMAIFAGMRHIRCAQAAVHGRRLPAQDPLSHVGRHGGLGADASVFSGTAFTAFAREVDPALRQAETRENQ